MWYAVGPQQIHLTGRSHGHFRTGKPVNNDDVHLALRVEYSEALVAFLKSRGYNENLTCDDPMRLIFKRTGLAGFPKVFLMNPDRNFIEINRAPSVTFR